MFPELVPLSRCIFFPHLDHEGAMQNRMSTISCAAGWTRSALIQTIHFSGVVIQHFFFGDFG